PHGTLSLLSCLVNCLIPATLSFISLSSSILPAATDIYTLSLHDALPISAHRNSRIPPTSSFACGAASAKSCSPRSRACAKAASRSEEHTSELQSLRHLVCRLLLEKKNTNLNTDRR